MPSGFLSIMPATGDASGVGRQISITDGSSPGQELHTTSATTFGSPSAYQFWDYISIEAVNVWSVLVTLTIEFGGTDDPADRIVVDLAPGLPPVSIVDRRPLTGGAVVRAFATITGKVNVHVQVERYQVG